MKRLENKVAIITGGAAGIGAATAKKFVAEGAQVVIWDMNAERGEQFAKELNITFDKVNTANYEEIEVAAKKVFDKFGRIDILVNNAGITCDSTLKR